MMDVIKCRKNPLNCDLLKESTTASYNELLSEVRFVERTLKSVPNRMRIVIEKEGDTVGTRFVCSILCQKGEIS